MAVQAFLMAGNDAEILDSGVLLQGLAEQPRRILDKDGIGCVQLGKGLFILALDHHLGFGRHRTAAMLNQILKPQTRAVRVGCDRNPRHRALRMRRSQLPARLARMFTQLQRTRAGRGIDIVQMHHLVAHALRLHQFQRDVVILIARQARAQAFNPQRKGKPHLQPRIHAVQIPEVVAQRRLHHLKTKGFFCVLVKRPHDPGHVDALFIGLQTDRTGDAGFQCLIATITTMEPDRQAKIRNPDVLDLLLGPTDEAGRPVLQIWQGGAVGLIGDKICRITAGQLGIIAQVAPRQQACNSRIQQGHLGGVCGFGPLPQQRQSRLGSLTIRSLGQITRRNIHGKMHSGSAALQGPR